MVAKPASAIAISIARMPNIGRATDKAAYMTVRMGGRDAAAAKSWRVSNVRSVVHATTRESAGAAKATWVTSCKATCVTACKATVATTAESAGMTAAASEPAMATTTPTAMSTATVLSKCGGACGQKRRQGTDGPQ
jgi:hypothetical protein